MPTIRLMFTGASGVELAARLERPAGEPPRAFALFAHCFTCSKDLKAAVAISRELARRGVAVLRFDFTGLGESEGDFADTNFSSNVDDLIAACAFLSERYQAPAILVGHSLGGAAVLQAAHRLSAVRAVVTIGAPSEPRHVLRHIGARQDAIRRDGSAEVSIGGRPFRVKRQFLEDLEATAMQEVLQNLDIPLLVMHSPVDRVVGIENAAHIYQAAKHPKSFLSLDTADHLLSNVEDSRYAAAVLAAWASRYIASPPHRTKQEVAQGTSTIATIGASGYRTDITTGGHRLIADEPEAVGGTDEGPSPYDLLAAALGSCTAMTLRMYADRKGWPLRGVQVELAHRRVHAEDGAKSEDGSTRVDRLERSLRLTGDLAREQRLRLLEIANRCPVHRTLDAGVKISTTLREDQEDLE